MEFKIPANLDLEKILASHPEISIKKRTTVDGKRKYKYAIIKTETLTKHLPYCYYLIDLIVRKSIETKHNDIGFINLKAEYLDKVIPNHTRVLVTKMLALLGVIEVNHTYQVKNHSKSYRISDKYPLTNIKTINIQKGLWHNWFSTDKLLCEYKYLLSINKEDLRGILEERRNMEFPMYSPFIDAMLTADLTPYLNLPKLTQAINPYSKRAGKVETKARKLKDKKTDDLIRNNIEYGFQQEQVSNINFDHDKITADGIAKELRPMIEKIKSGRITINVNNKVNRVFSPITNLKSEYRKYLRCKSNCGLIQIDFKSSHLFHLLKMIIGLDSNPLLLKEVEKVRCIALVDVYQHVQQQYLQSFNEVISRERAKEIFINYFLYSMYPNRKLNSWVKSLFPFIAKFIARFDRKTLSRDLQKSESHLLNNIMIKRIATECEDLKEITLYSVFDSLLVDKNHFDFAYCIMAEEASKYFGYKVPISIKCLAD